MNDFADFFWNKPKRFSLNKWHHYFDIYDRHFSKFKGKNPVIVEIGVQNGGSIEMWNHYFKGECTIYGIDVDPACSRFEKEFPNVKIFIGDQSDSAFLNFIKTQVPSIDILIDDGSHYSPHIIISIEVLYPSISAGGVYLIEDLHSNYRYPDGTGMNQPGSAIEYAKKLIDLLNAKHITGKYEPPVPRIGISLPTQGRIVPGYLDTSFSNITNSIHFYDSVLVLEKKLNPNEIITSSVM
jgi:hypothetical protein